MEIEIKPIQKADYNKAIQFAIKGMHFDWYLNSKFLLNAYGRYFWYLEMNRASIWEPRYIVYHRRISKIDLAVTVSNIMLGSADMILYAKYKLFLIGELFKIKWEFITPKNRRLL